MITYVYIILLIVIVVLLSVTLSKLDKKDKENYCVKISPFQDEYCGCKGGCTVFS